MEKFIAFNPVKLHFGKNAAENIGSAVKKVTDNALLVYGRKSIKENGIYDFVAGKLREAGVRFTEYHGIKANPVVDDVEKAIILARESNCGAVIAVGGGSVLDSAKIIALCAKGNHDPWKVMKYEQKPDSALPLFTVLTFAGTGSEMNQFAVLQNQITGEKIGYGNNLIFPRESFLDPSYTMSVPANQTAFGVVDLIAHSLEAYFGEGEAHLTDRFICSIIKEAIATAPLLMNNLNSYELRERIMWAATCALNGITLTGRKSGDWGVHDIGHTLSYLYDTPHGATLSIAYPAWMKHMKSKLEDRIGFLGFEVFGVSNPNETIAKFERFFSLIGSPVRLSEAGILQKNQDEIFTLMKKNKISGYFHKLFEDDYLKIIELMK